MYTVTIPTYEELRIMFPDSTDTKIRDAGLTIWELFTDEMRIPADRVLEFPEIRIDGTMHNSAYDIYIHNTFYDYLKALEPQTFGTHRSLGKPTKPKPF